MLKIWIITFINFYICAVGLKIKSGNRESSLFRRQ